MSKSGSFTGKTSPTQEKFLPVVYWTTNRVDTTGDGSYDSWKIDVYVNYKCSTAYLGVIDSQYVTLSVGSQTKKVSTRKIEDSNTNRHEGLWINTQTYYLNFNDYNSTSIAISLNISYMRNMNYSGVILKSCSASGSASLEEGFSNCSPPSVLTINPSTAKKDQNVTLSWSGAKAGTANSIVGYDIQYQIGSGAWTNLASISSTSSSGSRINSWNLPVGQTVKYRVRTRGSAGSNYYSNWSNSSSTLTIINTAPVMSFVNTNSLICPYNNGSGGSITFSWGATDKDGDSLRFKYKTSSSSWSSYTSETSRNILISGSQGSQENISVVANDYKEDSSQENSPYIRINQVPNAVTISFVDENGLPIEEKDLPLKPTSIFYKLSSKSYYSNRIEFQIYLEVSDSSDMQNSSQYYVRNINGNSSYTAIYNLNLLEGNETNYINKNQYYRIKVRAYDGYDYSDFKTSVIRQKNSFPNYSSFLSNTYDDVIEKVDDVYWRTQDGRLRKGNIIQDKVILNWENPTPEEGASALDSLRIYRSVTSNTSSSEWSLIATIQIQDNIETYTDQNIPNSGSIIKYKILFVDEYGWIQEDSNATILTLFKNTSPIFGNSFIRLSKVSSTGVPTIKVYDNEFLTVRWAKTNGDSDDDAIDIIPLDGAASSRMTTPDSFNIKLIFSEDPFISLSEGFPLDSNGEIIKEIPLATNIKATKDDMTYNIYEFTVTEEIFQNFSIESKRQKYSNVIIQIEAKDTFNQISLNKISTPISLDFRQNPSLDETSIYQIRDNTNNSAIAANNEPITENFEAYTKNNNYYMINSNEQLQFKFPKATSPNAVQGDDGIYSYLIYYSTSTTDEPSNNFILLKEVLKADLTVDNNYLLYNHTISNYSENTIIRFAVAARDSGYGRNQTDKLSNSLISNLVVFPYTIMACRIASPSLTLNNIEFLDPLLEDSRITINFSILDNGGSRNFEQSTYWEYPNFERFEEGRFFQLELFLSQKEDFPNDPLLTKTFILPISTIGATPYPPEESQKNDSEKDFAFPWSNYSIDTNINDIIKTNISYYAKLILKIGHNSLSSLSTDNSYLVAETSSLFLRSSRGTFSIRDKKIGINVPANFGSNDNPGYVLQVSGGSSNNTENYVVFDSGILDNNVIRFNLINSHMERGIIDCGRLI